MVPHYDFQPIVVYNKSLALVQTPLFATWKVLSLGWL